MKPLLALLVCGLTWVAACTQDSADTWTLSGKPLDLSFARTPHERTRGLQGRPPLTGDQGMLFIYDTSQVRSFWMRDVGFDIDLGYFDETGRLLSIHRLQAHDEVPVSSQQPVRYVLEMRAGWFADHDVRPGFIWKRLARRPRL